MGDDVRDNAPMMGDVSERWRQRMQVKFRWCDGERRFAGRLIMHRWLRPLDWYQMESHDLMNVLIVDLNLFHRVVLLRSADGIHKQIPSPRSLTPSSWRIAEEQGKNNSTHGRVTTTTCNQIQNTTSNLTQQDRGPRFHHLCIMLHSSQGWLEMSLENFS